MKFLEQRQGKFNTTIQIFELKSNIIFKTTSKFNNIGIIKNIINGKKEIKTSRDSLNDIINKVK